MLTLYENIKKRRIEKGWTQAELADALGYERSMIAKIEKGLVDLTLSRTKDFAKVLGTTPNELIGWNNKEELEADAIEIAKMVKKIQLLSAANRKAVSSLIDNLLEAQSAE
jgi:transcriptional regulator with XRE-family HTH domain